MTAPHKNPPAAASRRMSRSKRIVLIAAGSVVVSFGVAVLVVMVLSRSHPTGAPAGAASAAGPRTQPPVDRSGSARRVPEVDSRIFQVTEATGRVEARRNGQWVMVVTGDVLTQDDLVRTTAGRAILRRGATEIELRDRVEIRLDSISRAGTSVDLRRGRVVAHVGRAGGNVAITAARTRTENEGDAPARFVVTADEYGRVAVATTEGSARFAAEGRTVKVAAGNIVRAEPGEPPGDPEKISEGVFLSVTWPVGPQREDKVPVTGRTDVDAVVRINGTPTEVDRAGHFVASVPVRVGTTPVEIEVEDMSGRTKRETREIRKIPTRPPDLAPVKTELWKK